KKLEMKKRMAQHSFSAALELKEYNAIQQAEQNIIKINQLENESRIAARELISKANPDAETNDKDYVFIHFILNNLPVGLIGLLLAVILSAAMSSTSSELNALGTITALDLYKRHNKKEQNERHYLRATKEFTQLLGIVSIAIANVANLIDNLIQLLSNIVSIYYGNVLGFFLSAFCCKCVRGNVVFIAAIITQIIVVVGYRLDWMSYLWLNAFGCLLVILLAMIIQSISNMSGKKAWK